jgi:hypothetical protein
MSALEQNFNPDLEDIKRREDLGNIFIYGKILPQSQSIVLSSHLFLLLQGTPVYCRGI